MWWNDENLVQVLKTGGVVVMPTDTLYGIVGIASSRNTVGRIYEIRKRAPDKPCIILIGDMGELQKFSVNISEEQKKELQKYWSFDESQKPRSIDKSQDLRPVSVVLDCSDDKFAYLHRGTKTLAFRLPRIKELRDLLLKTGPLIAPSANTEALPASKNIDEAKNYFGDLVDLYVDAGYVTSNASRVVRLKNDGSTETLRS